MTDAATPRVLVLFAHPSFHRSRVHRALVRAVRAVDGVTFHDLYDAYPDFDVDVAHEQELLESHEYIVLQHPFYWYSTPALVKQWLDLVLEHGWAYGSNCTALIGKKLLSAVSTGGREESYRPEGGNRMTVRQLLAPIELTAQLCGIDYLEPFVVHGTHAMDEAAIAVAADAYARHVAALRDGKLG